MKTLTALILALLAAAVSGASAGEKSDEAGDRLFETISALDTEVFDSFNHCDAPGQLQKHASYFDPDIEFYHDLGGVTWSRQEMLASTEKFVCGHFRRELIPGTLRVFPIKDFGAISQGEHRFCQFETGKCEGIADFVIVWRNTGEQWQITRVLSYGHRALEEQNALATEDLYIAAEVNRDEAALRRLIDDRFVLNSKNGTTLGKEEFVQAVLGMKLVGQSVRERSVLMEGNIALIMGTADLRTAPPGKPESTSSHRYTATYVKRDGEWRMLALQIQPRAAAKPAGEP